MQPATINTIIQILFLVCTIFQVWITLKMANLKADIMNTVREEFKDVIRQREFDNAFGLINLEIRELRNRSTKI